MKISNLCPLPIPPVTGLPIRSAPSKSPQDWCFSQPLVGDHRRRPCPHVRNVPDHSVYRLPRLSVRFFRPLDRSRTPHPFFLAQPAVSAVVGSLPEHSRVERPAHDPRLGDPRGADSVAAGFSGHDYHRAVARPRHQDAAAVRRLYLYRGGLHLYLGPLSSTTTRRSPTPSSTASATRSGGRG